MKIINLDSETVVRINDEFVQFALIDKHGKEDMSFTIEKQLFDKLILELNP